MTPSCKSLLTEPAPTDLASKIAQRQVHEAVNFFKLFHISLIAKSTEWSFVYIITVLVWQQSIKEILENMTNVLVNISTSGDVMQLLYLETAQTNLIYALGKQLQASSSRSGANITVSSSCFRKVRSTFTRCV